MLYTCHARACTINLRYHAVVRTERLNAPPIDLLVTLYIKKKRYSLEVLTRYDLAGYWVTR